MSTTTPTAAAILAALSTLEAARKADTIKTAVAALDGVDERTAAVDNLANVLAALAWAVEADVDAQADSHLRAMEYGDALHLRVTAASVSEYANGVETAHERSFELVRGLDDEDEPTDAEAYSAALETYGLAD
jgi:hypothetical protein